MTWEKQKYSSSMLPFCTWKLYCTATMHALLLRLQLSAWGVSPFVAEQPFACQEHFLKVLQASQHPPMRQSEQQSAQAGAALSSFGYADVEVDLGVCCDHMSRWLQ